MGFTISEVYAVASGGGMGMKLSWDGNGSSSAKVVISVGNASYSFGGLYTTDLAKDTSQWDRWEGQPRQLPLSLGMPVYFIPRYAVNPGIWNRYSGITINPGGTATVTSNDNGSAGIVITVIATGGGGPDDEV